MVFILEAFFSGCISKAINDGKDCSWIEIKRVINDKNDRNLSTRIYRVIENALIKVTDKNFKGTDILYGAIERIFIEFRDNGNTIESVKRGLRLLDSDISIERCENFLDKFYDGVCQDEDLYKRISLILQEKGIKINQEEFQKFSEKTDKNHTELIQKIDSINENLNGSSLIYERNITAKKIIFKNNKKQDYIKNWNSRLFLHMDDKDNPITLADAFIMPDYIVHKFIKKIFPSKFIKKIFPTKDTGLNKAIEQFIEYDRSSTLLITGVPGIGKSSITSWIAQKYETDDNCIILRFRDWESDELEGGVLKAIYNTLECKKGDLNGKVIILDGFDEIKCLDRRDYLLHGFLNDINDLEKSKIVITSRLSYINWESFYNVIELMPFGINKIKKFYHLITGVELSENMIDTNNLDVLGIPVILYMAIMSDIDLNDNATKPELYNRIFAEKGGIFDRFYDGITEYGNGTQILRNPQNIKIYLEFLRNIAFQMFEKNILYLLEKDYQIPKLEFRGDSVSVLEFPIKNLFESTKGNVEFIHKSIYEYFLSEYIYYQIDNSLNKGSKIEIDLAGVLGGVLKSNKLTPEILEFLKYRIENSELSKKNDVVYGAFQLMLQDGMTYHTNECYKNVVCCELNVFANMLEIVHLWKKHYYIFDNKIVSYIKWNKESRMNLNKTDLHMTNLRGADLRIAELKNANLDMADLRRADLRKANLIRTSLSATDLRGADLREADLTQANLLGANLGGAIFDEAQVKYLSQYYNLEGIMVYIGSTKSEMSYQMFCKRKK